jgi:hypothetical protein
MTGSGPAPHAHAGTVSVKNFLTWWVQSSFRKQCRVGHGLANMHERPSGRCRLSDVCVLRGLAKSCSQRWVWVECDTRKILGQQLVFGRV